FRRAEGGIRDDLVTGVQTCALPSSGSVTEFLRARMVLSQREANSVHEEQSRLVSDLTVALNLPRAHALLAGASAPETIRPMLQRSEERRVGKDWESRRCKYGRRRKR